MCSNPAGGHGSLSVVSVVCCQVEVCATDSSLVKGSPTVCGVSECDREVSNMRRPWPTRSCRTIKKYRFKLAALKAEKPCDSSHAISVV